MNKFFKNLDILAILAIVALSYFAIKNTLVPGYFAMHDDLQAMRQLQMAKCFIDGQFPCRWVPDMGYLYGYPLFNFYPPLPYYLGQLFVWMGLQFIDVVKVATSISFIVSGIFMYLLAKEFWGRWGGVVSSMFYVYAPYHAVDIYVRGAMNEGWALAFFPGILWSLYKLINTNKWVWVIPLSTTTAGLMLSHNPMLMIFVPLALVWTGYWLWQKKTFKSFGKLVVSGLWTFGLAAFFTLPVLFEQKYAHLETLVIGYFNYLAHFADLNQLFVNINWGYGASELGPVDGMSFAIGHAHWIASIMALIVVWKLRKKKKDLALIIVGTFILTYAYAFLMHSKSTPIWKVVKPLEFLQFPWRILAITTLTTSFLAGSIVYLVKVGHKWVAIVLIAAVMGLNFQYFTWREYYPNMTDEEKFSGKLWQLQLTSSIFDYLPIWAPLPPANPPETDAEFLSGNGEITTVVKKSNYQEYKVRAEDQSTIQINSLYFPGWKLFVNNKEEVINPGRDSELGRIIVDLPKATHEVVIEFRDTFVRSAANYISLVAWLSLPIAGYILVKLRK